MEQGRRRNTRLGLGAHRLSFYIKHSPVLDETTNQTTKPNEIKKTQSLGSLPDTARIIAEEDPYGGLPETLFASKAVRNSKQIVQDQDYGGLPDLNSPNSYFKNQQNVLYYSDQSDYTSLPVAMGNLSFNQQNSGRVPSSKEQISEKESKGHPHTSSGSENSLPSNEGPYGGLPAVQEENPYGGLPTVSSALLNKRISVSPKIEKQNLRTVSKPPIVQKLTDLQQHFIIEGDDPYGALPHLKPAVNEEEDPYGALPSLKPAITTSSALRKW